MILKLQQIKNYINHLIKNGFFMIVISTVLMKIVSFTSNILFPRILDKTEYGLLAYADNIRGYFIIFAGMGLSTAMLRFGSLANERNERIGLLFFSWKTGFKLNLGLILVYIIVTILPIHPDGASPLLLQMSFLPLLLFIYDCIASFLRSDGENSYYSINAFFYSFMYALTQLLMAYILGLTGVVVGRYIGLVISIFIGLTILKKIKVFKLTPLYPKPDIRNQMLRYGIGTMINTGMSLVLPMNEMLVLSIFQQDYNTLANYKAASILPSNLPFLVNAVLIYIFPNVAKNSNDGKWIWNYYKRITRYSIVIFIPLLIILLVLSPQILLLFFGEEYMSSLPLMRIMWIVYTIQCTIRGFAGNMISAIGDVKFNNIISLITLILHFSLNVLFVKLFGISGAAWALLIAYIFYGVACIIRLYKYSKIK